jgi:hypothetical protein
VTLSEFISFVHQREMALLSIFRRIDAVQSHPGRSCALSISHSESFLYGGFAWARRALNIPKRRFPAPRAAACLVHYLLLHKVTGTRFTILNDGFRPRTTTA